MDIHREIIKSFIERIKRENIFSSTGLIELEDILMGPVEDVETDLVVLIKKENDVGE